MKQLCAAVLGTVLSLNVLPASAVTVDMYYDISGSGYPTSSTTPWLTASFTDVVGGVQLTLSALNLVNPENVKTVLFNYNGNNPLSATFQNDKKIGQYNTPAFHAFQNSFTFDLNFGFSSGANVNNTFSDGDVAVFLLQAPGISANNFAFEQNVGNYGSYASIALIQNTTVEGHCYDSGWIGAKLAPIPEPATMFAGFCLLGMLGWRERDRLQSLFRRA